MLPQYASLLSYNKISTRVIRWSRGIRRRSPTTVPTDSDVGTVSCLLAFSWRLPRIFVPALKIDGGPVKPRVCRLNLPNSEVPVAAIFDAGVVHAAHPDPG